MKSLQFHLQQIQVRPVTGGGFDVWHGSDFVGHRKTPGGAAGLKQAHASALADEDKREAHQMRDLARDWLGKGHYHAHAD